MATETKVVDASVIIKLLTPEAGSEEAERLLERHRTGELLLLAPEFVLLEASNVMRYKRKTSAEISVYVQTLYDLELHLEHLSEVLLERAASLALERDMSVYDALYAALAEAAGAPLVTADQELAQKVSGAELLAR
jgi:predicted nucleic acid-binding protein